MMSEDEKGIDEQAVKDALLRQIEYHAKRNVIAWTAAVGRTTLLVAQRQAPARDLLYAVKRLAQAGVEVVRVTRQRGAE